MENETRHKFGYEFDQFTRMTNAPLLKGSFYRINNHQDAVYATVMLDSEYKLNDGDEIHVFLEGRFIGYQSNDKNEYEIRKSTIQIGEITSSFICNQRDTYNRQKDHRKYLEAMEWGKACSGYFWGSIITTAAIILSQYFMRGF